jgi:peptidoglycan/LPS O-acetylase OafA/YrhL
MPTSGSLLWALYEGLFGAIFHFEAPGSFNPVLWTMTVQFQGAMLVFGVLALTSVARAQRFLIYAVALIAIMAAHAAPMISFLFGIVLCDLYCSERRIPQPAAVAAIVLGLLLGGFRADLLDIPTPWAFDILGAALLIGGVLFGRFPFLEIPFAVWLGRVSFGLYLTHLLVILSAGCAIYVALRHADVSHNGAAAAAFAVSVPLSFLAAWAMYRLADAPAARLSIRVSRAVLAEAKGAQLRGRAGGLLRRP